VRVLVAEQDAGSREDFKEKIEAFGHECLLARDGIEEWQLYQNTPQVDVVMSDRAIGGIDGLEVCRRIRRAGREGYTFFVFLSDSEDEEDQSLGMRAGADDYLSKPLDGEHLRDILLTASRVASLRRRLNGGGKADTNGGSKELALRDESRLRATGSLSTKRLGLGGIKLWDALIAQGRVTEDQVQLALEAQRSDPRSLRKIMVSLGIMLAGTLKGIVGQRLVRTKDGKRAPACEVMVSTGRIQDFIVNPTQTAMIQQAISEGEYYGMQTFDQALLKLVEEDRMDYGEALRHASRPQDFKLMVQALGLGAGAARGGS
jgi:CheY-like chemotaxis protein